MLLHCMDGCFLMLVAVVYVVESRGAFLCFFWFATCIECNLIWEGTEWNNNKNNRDTKDKRGLATKKEKEGTRRSPAFL